MPIARLGGAPPEAFQTTFTMDQRAQLFGGGQGMLDMAQSLPPLSTILHIGSDSGLGAEITALRADVAWTNLVAPDVTAPVTEAGDHALERVVGNPENISGLFAHGSFSHVFMYDGARKLSRDPMRLETVVRGLWDVARDGAELRLGPALGIHAGTAGRHRPQLYIRRKRSDDGSHIKWMVHELSDHGSAKTDAIVNAGTKSSQPNTPYAKDRKRRALDQLSLHLALSALSFCSRERRQELLADLRLRLRSAILTPEAAATDRASPHGGYPEYRHEY